MKPASRVPGECASRAHAARSAWASGGLPSVQHASCVRRMPCAACHVEMLPWQHHVCRTDLRGLCAVCVRRADGHVLGIMFASEVPGGGCEQLYVACERTGASGAGRGAQRIESPWHGHEKKVGMPHIVLLIADCMSCYVHFFASRSISSSCISYSPIAFILKIVPINFPSVHHWE